MVVMKSLEIRPLSGSKVYDVIECLGSIMWSEVLNCLDEALIPSCEAMLGKLNSILSR